MSATKYFKVMILRKSNKKLGNQHCNGLKTPRVQAVYSFLLYLYCNPLKPLFNATDTIGSIIRIN